MLLPILAVVFGLVLLVWSAERFVEGAACSSRHFGMPPLLIGMVVVGFGTSVPELLVSSIAAIDGNAGIALGNAYGSNITNIALILGLTALLRPIAVTSGILRRELPILIAVTALAAFQVEDGRVSRFDAIALLIVFFVLMGWTILSGLRARQDALANEAEREFAAPPLPLRRALLWTAIGLALLIVSSRALVWGAVEIAQEIGVSDLIVGLTVVAVGTSLPELASSIVAARKGEHDLALGNVLGSNLFNTLAVVGLAGVIEPFAAERAVFTRDIAVMGALTLALAVMGLGFGKPGRIDRIEGGLLLAAYFAYTAYLVRSVML